ncbi:hypothetical protein JB92DRAFT_2982217 [Gautieria morchelliformis]|nr:hypothetical protein JB92DRAFT_2982217 [Gautieria morchelliformis]
MCHLSPTVHLAWAILASGLQIFLIQHLWRYDRFKCLAWSSGRRSGTFKRVMTYSYLGSVPLLVAYSVSMAVLKYRNGYTFIDGRAVPTPFQLWSKGDQAWLTPLYILFSVAWGMELVTHLEELLFWLFLLHQGQARREWFSSIEFRAWVAWSLVAMAGMPITAILTREDRLKSEAYIFLVGGSSSACITAVFFIVLVRFPGFLRRVQKEGAAGPVILRLVKFHELNILRVIFRLFMTIPFIILGVDGIRGHHPVNASLLWTDLLAFLAAVGMVVSSTMTLLIFFPRSLAEDSNWLPGILETQTHGSFFSGTVYQDQQSPTALNMNTKTIGNYHLDATKNPFTSPRDSLSPNMISKVQTKCYRSQFTTPSAFMAPYYPHTPVGDSKAQLTSSYELRTIEKGDADSGIGLGDTKTKEATNQFYEDSDQHRLTQTPKDDSHLKVRMMELAEAVDAGLKRPSRHPGPRRLHPYITSFTSPIDLLQYHSEADVPRAI